MRNPLAPAMMAGAVILLGAVPARAQDAHGAIAFAQITQDLAVAYGFAWDYPSRDAAQEAAVNACLDSGGSDCTVLAWFQNGCGALAMDQYGIAQGKGATSLEQAEARALQSCEAGGGVGCTVVGSECVSSGGQPDTWTGSESVLAPPEESGPTVGTVHRDPPATDAPRDEGLTREERLQVQQGLSALGFDAGPADGMFGPRTRSAISEWQQAKGLETTGYLSREEAEVLAAAGADFREQPASRETAELESNLGALRTRTAAAKEDDEAYERARADHTVASYEQYLTEYPNARHADEARRLLAEARDDEAYERAQAEDTSSAYEAYLHGYANGRHVDDARRLLAAAVSREESRPGRRFQDCDDCPLMVVVPPGSYMMGSPASARRFDRDEEPQHAVTIGYSLAVGVYEVTLAEYRRFAVATGHNAGAICWRWNGKWSRYQGTWSNPGYLQTDRDPVVCVSWEDAMEYVRWLSRETGEEYRLLSEAEWEYVARGGTNTARYWGEESAESYWADESSESQCRYANGADRTLRKADRHQDWEWDFAACDDGYHRTAPAGTYEENGYGLHDVLGNVWEWTQDCKSENYDGAPSDGSSWEIEACDSRVIRGGSWSDSLDSIRAGNRAWATTEHRDYTLGFRVARTIKS